jgi:hypothetical protein
MTGVMQLLVAARFEAVLVITECLELTESNSAE